MKKFAELLFRIRSYTPIPFIVVMLFFYNGNANSWIIGSIFLMLGEVIRLWSVIYAGSLTRTTNSVKAHKLVTSGPYAHVRNPLYEGNILIYFGAGVITYALFPYLQIIALAWFVFQYLLIINIEEEFLENKFGRQYMDYKEKVPRFIPILLSDKFSTEIKVDANFQNGIKSEVRTFQAILSVVIITFIIHLVK